MSFSPPHRIRSAASATSKQEDLINAYEAEEERIINVLSRKLEQLREEKIGLENALEAESESHVNRMSRELTALRLAQQQQNGSTSVSTSPGFRTFMSGGGGDPSGEAMLEAMRRENEQLRNRLVDTERDYIRISRLNEIYREELIEHRRRLGLSVDNLIGLPSPDPFSQPTHHRRSSFSNTSSPSMSIYHIPHHIPRTSSSHAHGVPIPRLPVSHAHRPTNNTSESNTPLSHSPSSSESPFPFSPIGSSTNPASFLSSTTNITTPPSSLTNANVSTTMSYNNRGLSYPSVPPPSLSSSFGSPSVSYHMPHRDREHSLSPIEPLSRRNSNARRGSVDRWVVGGPGSGSGAASRRASVDRGGARVAETGSLLSISRSRAGSHSHGLAAPVEVGGVDDERGEVHEDVKGAGEV